METKRQNEDQTEALKREYQAVMKLNETFTAVNDNLIGAREKLQVGDFLQVVSFLYSVGTGVWSSVINPQFIVKQFANTMDQTDTLLDIWIKILSQSLHTQRLLSDPSWQGQTTVTFFS